MALLYGMLFVLLQLEQMALVVGSGGDLAEIGPALDELRGSGAGVRIVFLDASTPTLVRRYGESKRRHPLAAQAGTVAGAIDLEREVLAEVRQAADIVIDTSELNVHDLRSRVNDLFAESDGSRMQVTLQSFGFKHGLPIEFNIVLDVRFLPNPYFEPALRDLDGRDPAVARYVLAEGADGSSMTRTIPMELVESGEVLVAYGQNGEMLRPENGYPLRLVVPGVQGVSWVKYLRRIEVGDKPYATKDEAVHYIDLMKDGQHRQYTSIQECKSVVTTPSGGQVLLDKGFYNITGLAWSGKGKIKRVDVSVDGGRNWRSTLERHHRNRALLRVARPGLQLHGRQDHLAERPRARQEGPGPQVRHPQVPRCGAVTRLGPTADAGRTDRRLYRRWRAGAAGGGLSLISARELHDPVKRVCTIYAASVSPPTHQKRMRHNLRLLLQPVTLQRPAFA